ncbi:phosphatase PAP2 family protein [uncultured Jatrophihabitans sp.]|uniref:phosphatase PAP2 family protein n=1 Tax=uncultured Jatrophihabitans sp. TaxID=1610747 RepID=UPI0035CB72C8
MFGRRELATARPVPPEGPATAPLDQSMIARARRSIREHPSAWRTVTLVVVLVVYLALTLGVLFNSPVIRVDRDFLRLDLRGQFPSWDPWIKHYVIFGQRGPATLFFLPYFCWVTWRTRSTRPLVLLATSFVLLNVSVGVVKLATGRLGPRQTSHAHEILVGGDIYPSGHVSNAVVLYGLIAMIAIKHRRFAVWSAVFLSVTVGLGTVYLDTHWFSDVVGGWFAGAIVLLLLPSVMPYAQRWADAVTTPLLARWRRRRGRTVQAAAAPQAVASSQSAKTVTPVISRARSQSFAATSGSREALDDRTRCG